MKHRILIIEDNEPNLYLLTFILERCGHEVLSARTGPEGLERAIREEPDLVLTDLQLPGLDGYEVARRLRAHERLRHVPIVAVTAYAMVGDREKALACGCTGYIEKPIIPTRFREQIATFLPRHSRIGRGPGRSSAEQPRQSAGRASRAV